MVSWHAVHTRAVPRLQVHARCVRWGLRRFSISWSFLALGIGPQRQTLSSVEWLWERGNIVSWLAVAARATLRPQGHARFVKIPGF